MAQIDLAEALNVDFGYDLTQSDISEIERQARGVRDFELKSIASIFETTVDSLLPDDSGADHPNSSRPK